METQVWLLGTLEAEFGDRDKPLMLLILIRTKAIECAPSAPGARSGESNILDQGVCDFLRCPGPSQ